MNLEWEEIYRNGDVKEEKWLEATYRAKVIGGWMCLIEVIYDYYSMTNGRNKIDHSLVFIPDPNHDWGKCDNQELTSEQC